jgi:hypothetical protein
MNILVPMQYVASLVNLPRTQIQLLKVGFILARKTIVCCSALPYLFANLPRIQIQILIVVFTLSCKTILCYSERPYLFVPTANMATSVRQILS